MELTTELFFGIMALMMTTLGGIIALVYRVGGYKERMDSMHDQLHSIGGKLDRLAPVLREQRALAEQVQHVSVTVEKIQDEMSSIDKRVSLIEARMK